MDKFNFKKYLTENKLTTNSRLNEGEGMIPAKKLFALIARDLKFAGPVQDNVMYTKEEAIEIMRHIIEIEESDISPEAALGEYIASGDL